MARRRIERGLTAAVLCALAGLACAQAPAEIPAGPGLHPATPQGLTPPPRGELMLSGTLDGYKRYGLDIPSSWVQAQAPADDDAQSRRLESKQVDRAAAAELASRKSYVIPALEILGFQAALNLINRPLFGCCDYNVSLNSIGNNLHGKWVTDNDPYSINQLGHPYQGSMYHGFARSAGLNFWEGLAYTFVGSAVWEIAGETTPPSKNDQITTGIGGAFLGEALFRMSNLFLEKSTWRKPWKELGAAAISPPVGFNRLVFDDRFDKLFESRSPSYYSRLQVGASTATENNAGTSKKVKRTEGLVDFSLDYGLPGKPGYAYTRPFDYFAFQATASTANGFENLLVRGLLVGRDYDLGENYRGVWGLYGNYDYIAPQTFRVSSTGASFGTTAEWWLSNSVALQYTALAGAGYASVGTINGVQDRDYHNGVAPNALLALRLIFSDRVSLDVTGRKYFLSGVAASRAGREGRDDIARADVSFSWRIYKQHALAIKYQWSERDAWYPDLGDRTQRRATVGVFYTLLGREGFSAADWRK